MQNETGKQKREDYVRAQHCLTRLF